MRNERSVTHISESATSGARQRESVLARDCSARVLESVFPMPVCQTANSDDRLRHVPFARGIAMPWT